MRNDIADKADASALIAEANLFMRIKDGVMLTLAECELTTDCSPSVTIREVQRILEKIDIRITSLIDRYTETNNQDLEQALLIYADAREGYAEALDRLEALPGTGDEELGGDAFGSADEEDAFSDLFEDVGEDL